MARLTPEYVVASLVQRGVPEHVAQGVVMNFQDESGLNTGIQEKAPTRGRGGFGLAQWTGPRRIALEDFARSQGKSIDDPDMQLDFFMQENAGVEAPAWKVVMSAPTAQDAAVAFVNKWERPAPQHAVSRSLRYQGLGPGEGAGRFGGTGLGTPIDASDSPSESAGGPGSGAVVNPNSPYKLKAKKKSDIWNQLGKTISKGVGGMGVVQAPVMGAGGNAPQLPSQAPIPGDAYAVATGPSAGAGRDELALLMQRLNSGQLWG